MVECYLCKGKLRVTRDKHVFDEKLKKRYHFKCFAGICRVCDMPVYAKAKHKVIGANVWHEKCYKTAHRANPRKRTLKTPPPPPRERKLKLPPPPPMLRKLRQKNPHRPTKEFWAKHYPEVFAQYKKKYPKKEAEERARKATAAIWYETMGPEKKKEYERIRRKREARENPIRHLMFSGDKAPAAVFSELEGKKYQIPEGWWIIPDSANNRRVLQKHRIGFTKYNRPSAAEIVKAYDEQEGRENPEWITKWKCPVHGIVPDKEVYGEEFGPKYHDCGQQVEETEMQAVRGEEGETLYFSAKKRENPTEDEFEKRLVETLNHDFLIFSMAKLPATKSVTVMSLRPVPVSKSTYSVDDTPEHRRLLDELGIEYTVLKISPEHAKLLVKEMVRRYRKNPTLVTPEMETDIVGAFKRVIHGMGTEADRALVRMAREADVIMSTGPSVLLKRNPEECGPVENPEKLDYIIQDEFGTTFETGKGTEEQAEARALHYNKKYMRSFKVIYPKSESPEVKKAAQTAAREMLKS